MIMTTIKIVLELNLNGAVEKRYNSNPKRFNDFLRKSLIGESTKSKKGSMSVSKFNIKMLQDRNRCDKPIELSNNNSITSM